MGSMAMMREPFKLLQSGLRTILTAVIAVWLFLTPFSADPEAATRQDKAVYAYSLSPYRLVGNLNSRLSYACRKREFSQKRQFRYIIGFVGKSGRAITGIATTNWNLYDPRNLADEGMTYHFYNDGYSDCEVYVYPQPID